MWEFFFTFSLLLMNINCWNKTLNRNKKLLWWKKIVVMISFVPFLYWIKHDGRHHFPHEYNVLTQSLPLKLRSFKKRYCHHKTLIKSLFMKPPSMWRKNMFSHKEGTYSFLTWILPMSPVDSILLATFTVLPQMSYWGFCAPTTPATTHP